MDQFKGSLRFIPLPAVTQFVAGLGSTGRLKLTQGAWSGDITLRSGEVVAVRLGGYETGRVALDGLVLGLTDAEFAFSDEPVDAGIEPLMPRPELDAYLAQLMVERDRLQLPTDALSSVPCLIDQPAETSEASQVTIQAGALQLIPALMHGHTLEQIALRRGLARTLREMATLQAGGLARLEAVPGAAQRPAAAAVRPQRPGPAPAASERTLREQVTPRAGRPLGAQRNGWWETGGPPPEPRPAPTLKAVPPAEPRAVDPGETVRLPRLDSLTPEAPAAPAARGGGLRGALLGFFVAPKS